MDRIPFTDYKMVNKNNRQEVFTLMDVDGDKRLNRTDVELALPILMPDLPVNAIDMFPRWDRDGDEYLDGDEYQRFMDDMPPEAFPLPELDQTFVVVRDPEQTATLLEHLTSIGMILLVHDNLTIAQRVLLIDDLLGIVSVPELNATVSFSNLNAEDLERIRGAGEAIELGQGDFERMGDAIGINVRQGDEEEG